ALGDTVKVPTLDGIEEVNVKPGTQTGTKIRLQGKGIPHLNRRGRGDEIVRLKAVTPEDLDREERELMAKLDSLLANPIDDHSEDSESFFDKLKKFREEFRN
ncbi:MAG: DnaJ C-terminal domain-containing protein, partial [Candidatus Bipolaricaulota bacterium]